jgi:tmRNA-binding protein
MTRAPPPTTGHKVIATNRKAFFNYEIFEEGGGRHRPDGLRRKSIREGGLNFRDSSWTCARASCGS